MGSSGRRWKIATIRGIPLYVSSSWVVIAGLYVYLEYFRLTNGGVRVSEGEAIALAVMATVLFFGSVLVHEASHAVMARALDLPVMGITLVFWGGATETKSSARGPLGEFLVSFVGPASTLVLAGLFWLLAQAAAGVMSEILSYLAGLSLVFAGVNALPGFPLDGGRMLLAGVWGATRSRRTAMRVTGYVGVAIGVAMLAAAVWTFSQGTGWGLFLGYLGFVLLTTGRTMDQRVAFRDQLVNGRASDAMRPPPPTVPADIPLLQALDHYLREADGFAFPVVDNGRVVGTVSLASARKVGARDPMRPVRDGMAPLNQTPVVAPDETLDDVLEWLGGREGLVLRDGMVVGSIAPTDIERWYRRTVEGRVDDAAGPGYAVPPGDTVPPRPDL